MKKISPNALIVLLMFMLTISLATGCPAGKSEDEGKSTSPDDVWDNTNKTTGATNNDGNRGGEKKVIPSGSRDNVGSQDAGKGDPIQKINSDGKRPQKELFTDWGTPEVVLFAAGVQRGYIEPCGCTGLANQKGGLMRRASLLKDLRDRRKWNVVPVDLGGLVRRVGRQPEIKFQTSADALRKMGYQAIGFGPEDLQLTGLELFSAVASAEPILFVSANVEFVDLGESLVHPFRIITAGKIKVGVTTVLGETFSAQVKNRNIRATPPVEALEKIVPEMKNKCDVMVLLARCGSDEAKQLAKKFPDFNVVITPGDAPQPPKESIWLDGPKTTLIELGEKGMYAGAVGLYGVAEKKIKARYQLIPIDDRFSDDKEITEIFAAYQKLLEEEWKQGLDKLGLRPRVHPSGRQFVGSKACADCHTEAYAVWEKTPHAHATLTIVKPPERSTISRQFDSECVSCHAVGWEPRKFFPYESGFESVDNTPLKMGMGCENCHGPGSRHVAIEHGDVDVNEKEEQDARKEMILAYKDAQQTCIKCHDLDNSPDFHKPDAFEKYWEKVKHKGKE